MKNKNSKKTLILVLMIALVISMMPIFPGTNSYAVENTTDFAGGEGTVLNPFHITTKEHLNNIRSYPNACFIMDNNLAFTQEDFILGGDYYNNGMCWNSIGAPETPFTGVFDGNGYSISNLCQKTSSASPNIYGGLFGYISGGTVKNTQIINLNLINTTTFPTISGSYPSSYAGSIAGYIKNGIIDNCTTTGNLEIKITAPEPSSNSTFAYLGGIVGKASNSNIINSTNSSTILATSTYDSHVGGIVGLVESGSRIINCKNNNDVSSYSRYVFAFAGGISAENKGDIQTCRNSGKVVCESRYYEAYAGGITGNNSGEITKSYNTGSIQASIPLANNIESHIFSGGISGNNSANISDCYNTAIISGSSPYPNTSGVGGITGLNAGSIKTCFNLGKLISVTEANNILKGGVVGVNNSIDISSCYFLDNNSLGVGLGTGETAKLTITQLGQQNSFNGFNFINIWEMNLEQKIPTLIANPPISLTNISFGNTAYNVARYGVLLLSPIISPANAETKITYKSANTAVATVSSTGTVTGTGLGSTTVTVTDAYTGKSAACLIYVRQGIDSLNVSGSGMVDVGSTTQLSTTITPTTPYDKTILWKSSDETVATVSESGLVSGIKAGTATIYATAKLGTPTTQNVAHPIQVIQHPVSIELNSNTLEIAVGENQTLTPTVLPEDTTNKNVTWSSSNENIATVSSDGLVTAVSRGEATITAKTADGSLEATCTVNAIQKVESVWITYDNLPLAEYTIAQGASVQFAPDIQPDNANNQGITWYTSDPNVITVDGTGLVTAISEGVAIVTIVSDNENKVDTCVVYVGNQRTGTLEINSDSLKDGEVIDFNQTELFVPSLSSFLAVDKISKGFALIDSTPVQLSKPQWSTSDPTVATVDKLGYVHVVGAGPVTITAYATDSGRVTSSKEVTIIRDFSITYKLNGGTNPSGAPAAYTYATGCTLAKPTRTGYAFGGWYEASNFTGSPVTAISITDKGDKTLYAKWIPNTYTIKFNDNGVTTGTMASLPMTYDVAKTLPANAFKKTGYAFLGWAKTSTGSVAYKDKASVKNLTATNKATVNLYAKWGAPILSAASYNYTGIKVSWATAGGATSYKIYRATSATGSYYLVKTAASTSRSWIDTGRTTGKTYYYKIYPVAGGTTYKFSTYKSAKAVPSTPTLTLSENTSTSIKVSWTGVSGATKYQVYRAGKSSTSSTYGDYALVYTGSSDTRFWIDSGRHIGSTYKYKVRAYHLEGTTKVYGGYSTVKYLKI